MSHYRQPAPHITQAVLAPANPTISFSPDRKHFLAIEHPSHPSLDALAKPFLKLAGSRWDPTRPGYQTTLHGSEIRITNVATGQTRTVTDLPAGIRIDGVNWSPDSNWMSVTADMDGGGIGLYVIDVETLSSREVTGLRLKDSLAATTQWLRDSSAIYATAVPDGQPPFPQPTVAPDRGRAERLKVASVVPVGGDRCAGRSSGFGLSAQRLGKADRGGDGGFDGILDGGASALTLPSSEGASVIREGELESHGKWVSCRGDRGGD